jgi:NhaP-type Na+/H+ or K+/H+ antiporter
VEFIVWYVVVGAVFVTMALTGSVLRRLPLTTALLYLGIGFVLGPNALGLLDLHPLTRPGILERLTEVAVIISLFSAGLKLRLPWRNRFWLLPFRLAFVSMAVTVGLIALIGVFGLGLPLGAAVLLGAVLAPTDPVLASDVAVEEPGDNDRLRFSLTGEAGLNDGTAFPFVMLGIGLLGVHDLGELGWRWLAVDLIWAVAAGLGVGALLGSLVGHVVIYLRRERKEAIGLDDFLALGLIALAYGVALLINAYGFLAVFAAGQALRRTEWRSSGDDASPNAHLRLPASEEPDLETHRETAPAYMAQAVLDFNKQLERIGTVLVMILVGGMLAPRFVPWDAIWFVPLLFFVVRPLAAIIGLIGAPVSPLQRGLIAWFGIRGIGSIYYLTYAISHGVSGPTAQRLAALTLTVVAVSVIVHGVSVTPLMDRYNKVTAARRGRAKMVPTPASE